MERLLDKRALARAADAGHQAQQAQRELGGGLQTALDVQARLEMAIGPVVPKSVRADNEVRLNGSPIGEAQACSATELPDLGQPMIEMQPDAAQRTAQDALEVRAVDPVVGRTANPLVTHVLMNRMRRDA